MRVVGVSYEQGFTGSRQFDKDDFTRPEIIIFSNADFVDCFRPYEVE